MSFTDKRLCNPTQLTTSGQTLYTVPSSKTSIIKQIVVTNITGSAATFSLYIGSAATPNALFSATSVAANDTIIINLSQVLNSLEILTALASASNSLNITISGVENDGPLNPLSIYIADNAITTSKISDSSITTAKIAPGAVVNVDIASNTITQDKLDTSIPLSGMRNVLINGAFDVWQRWIATSINVNAGTTAYTADRWFMSPVGATMGAIRDTNVPPTNISQYSLQIAPNGTGGSTCNIGQKIESANVYFLKGTVTFSAWIFNNTASAMTPVLLIGTPSALDNFTTVNNRLTQSLQSCPVGVWTRVTHTVDISGYTNINNGLQIEIQTSGHTTFGRTARIAEVQLERSTQATAFEERPIGLELALCQRYYWRWVSQNNGDLWVSAYQPASTLFFQLIPMPVRMRTRPTSATISGSWLYVNTPDAPTVFDRGDSWMIIQSRVNSTIGNTNQSAFYSASGSSTLIQEAEL